jgi:DnaA family protein
VNNPKQLIFPFQINQKASFESFFCSPDNIELMGRLADLLVSKNADELIINGAEGSGKSFLMQAICNELSSSGKQFAFMPMNKAINMGVEIFQNLASLNAVCIDDLQLILSREEWETALFNLINEFMKLQAVQDECLNQALDFVSQQLGINLEKAELEFLLNHQTREFSILVDNLISLDKQAASLKRKITIPLIKETLNI